VTGQLVRSAKALRAAWELAHVRLLAGVGADVSRLVLQSVEGLGADWALVGSWQVLTWLLLLRCILHGRRDKAGSSHWVRNGGSEGRCEGSLLLWLRVQQISEMRVGVAHVNMYTSRGVAVTWGGSVVGVEI
jgi:hypothetical protein